MELADYVKPWGEKRRMARALGCDSQLIGQWAAKQRPVPVERCPHIERESQGAVRCEDSRPDVTWVRVTDPDWPWHPNGRPLLDLTAAQATANPAAVDTRQAA
jgi:hypothetical protein